MKDKIIKAVIENKSNLLYINLDKNNAYKGWTWDFNIRFPDNKKMSLDLTKEDNLFLLFVLASSWSKSGAWENAAFFTTYLKYYKKNKTELY